MGGGEGSGLTAPSTMSIPYVLQEFEKCFVSKNNKIVGIRLT